MNNGKRSPRSPILRQRRSYWSALLFVALLASLLPASPASQASGVDAPPLTARPLARTAPQAIEQFAIWTFDGNPAFSAKAEMIPTTEATAGSAVMIMNNADVDSNGKGGVAYTDIANVDHPAGQAAAWDDIKKGDALDAELILKLDTTDWYDLGMRFNYRSDSATVYSLSYSTDFSTTWTLISSQAPITAGYTWEEEQIDPATLCAVQDQGSVWLRLDHLDDKDGNDRFTFDNWEIAGTYQSNPDGLSITVAGSTTPFLNLPAERCGTVSGVVGDPTDPALVYGIDFITNPALKPTLESSNTGVVPTETLSLTGSAGNYNLKIEPAAAGYADITVQVSNGASTASYIIRYAASAAADDTAAAHFHTGISDASSAIALDADHMWVANDELIDGKDMLYLFDRNNSGRYTQAFDVTADVGTQGSEMDLEASTWVSDTIYWLSSHSNNNSGKCRPDRYRLFGTTVSGTSLTYAGRYDYLRTDLIAWDHTNLHGKGIDYYGFVDSAFCDDQNDTGIAPKREDGFNIEGLARAPGSNIGFIGFRAPLTTTNGSKNALIVPLTNMTALLDPAGGGTVDSAKFGDPIELDLGGRGIRSIARNENDEYLIIAGPAGEAGAATDAFLLYSWTGIDPVVSGNSGDEPVLLKNLTAISAEGSWEGIVDMPTSVASGQVQLLMDNGTVNWYGDNPKIESKLQLYNWQKFRSEWVTLGSTPPPPNTRVVTNTDDSGAGSLRQAIADVANGGSITFDGGLVGETIALSSGPLVIDKDLMIDGQAARGLRISGGNTVGVFEVQADMQVSIKNLTVQDGISASGGGGIFNRGILDLENVTLMNNVAAYGGGIYQETGTLTITNSTLSGNVANGADAGIHGGGAIDQYENLAETTLIHTTITGNSAPNVAGRDGLWVEDGLFTIVNSIVSGNGEGAAAADCAFESSAAVDAATANIAGDNSCTGFSMPNTDPGLDALADNGGASQTHALSAGSPAIDAADANGCSGVSTDQRGVARPQGPACDIGAFELVQSPNTAPVAQGQSVSTTQDTPVTITLQATDADGDTLTFAVVTQPSHGTLGGVAASRTYTPTAGFVGSDSFTFRANDGTEDSNTATVMITVSGTGTTAHKIFLPMVRRDRPPVPGQFPVTPVAAGSVWDYLDDGSNQGTAWREINFDDSAWKTGLAQLGYGDGDENTTVDYGSATDKHITTYFRRSFAINDPANYRSLGLLLLRDDGAVVYLNGQEVARSNMPAGPIAYDTPASGGIGGAGESAWHPFSLDLARLKTGTNVIAVEIHQANPTSSDISFDLELGATPDARMLVPAYAEWKYLVSATAPNSDWRQIAFDDGAWPSGAGQLGYGDGDENTTVGFGADANNKYTTTYFRRAFTVADPAAYKMLELELLRDDGAVVYLNGQEIVRSNMPAGAIAYDTAASSGIGGNAENAWYHASVDAARLRAGKNVVAVEVHQVLPNSSDISFNLRLSATPANAARFATIGDYGLAGDAEKGVADLVKAWKPDFIVTMGDNSYGAPDTGDPQVSIIDFNIGQYYSDYIGNYQGQYGAGSATNRFWPSIGNHDYTDGDKIDAYLNYFTLPDQTGNERYYETIQGPVHLFAIDDIPAGQGAAPADGRAPDSLQGQWLESALGASTAPWKLVYFHYPPYSSGDHGSDTAMQWPYAKWGASAVMAGHDHSYERIEVDGFPYFVNGSGGAGLRKCSTVPVTGSQICYVGEHGAMLVEATGCYITFTFVTSKQEVIDTYTLVGSCQP